MLVFCGIQRLFRLQKPWRASTLEGLNPKVMNRSYKAADSLPGQAARLCKCSACAPLFPPWKPFASFSCNLKETGIPKMLRNSVQGRVSPRSGWSGFAISRDVRNREPGPALKNVRIPLCVYFCGFPSTCLHVHICPCTHVYVDVRAQSWVPNILHLAFWGRSLTEPEFADSARLASHTSRQLTCLSLCWDYKHTPLYLAFGCGFRRSQSSPYVCMTSSSLMESISPDSKF